MRRIQLCEQLKKGHSRQGDSWNGHQARSQWAEQSRARVAANDMGMLGRVTGHVGPWGTLALL